MSRGSRFGGLNATQRTAATASAPTPKPVALVEAEEPKARRSVVAKAREGKKPVIGYFSEELSRELRIMAASESTTMQALLGEAIDLLMAARNKNRFGER